MPKLTINRGFPGSGKSTATLKLLDKHTVCVNRDYLRMMTGGKWWPANEDLVTDIQMAAIEAANKRGLNVIVDDTFLRDKWVSRMQELANKLGMEFAVNNSFMEVSLATCIKRDAARERSVGKDVIERMYYDYWAQYPTPPNTGDKVCVICDIDGTLAHKQPAASWYERDYMEDTSDPAVIYMLSLIASNQTNIIIVSGRDEQYRSITQEWLARERVPYDKLFMRPDSDKGPDYITKKNIYKEHIQGKYEVLFVIDDRPSVIRMWRAELGLKVFNVGQGIEF